MAEYISMFEAFQQTEYSEEKYDDLCKMAWDLPFGNTNIPQKIA